MSRSAPFSLHEKWIACLAATPGEAAGVRGCLQVEHISAERGFSYLKGRCGRLKVLLVYTGMGRSAAERAARYVFGRYPVAAALNLGFAGALAPNLQAGDLVLCQRVYPQDAGEGLPACADLRLLKAAQALQVEGKAPSLGSSLCADQLVRLPEEKQALHEAYLTQVVEMEGYWLGRVCHERQIPFLSIRAISDLASQRLPPLEYFTGPEGEPRYLAGLGYFLAHPGEWADLVQFIQTYRPAQRRLAQFAGAYLQSLAQSEGDA